MPGVSVQIENPMLQNVPYHAVGFSRWVKVLGEGRARGHG
jgi:hypothetical protein